MKEKAPPPRLPVEIFHACAALFPRFVRVSQKLELSGIQIFALWYMRHNGAATDDGQWAVPREECTELLRTECDYSAQNVERLLSRLESKNLILRTRARFNDPTLDSSDEEWTKPKQRVVVVLSEGQAKIEEFKQGIGELFVESISQLPPIIRSPLLRSLPMIARAAAWLLQKSAHAEASRER
jgi:hypothetical protein